MAEKGSEDSVTELTLDAPPPYSGLGYSWAVGGEPQETLGGPLEDQVRVAPRKVEEAIARSGLHLDLTYAQKDTIRRLTESLLKRSAREQGVLPTALQVQFTLEHIVSKFSKTSRGIDLHVRTAANSSNVPRSPYQSNASGPPPANWPNYAPDTFTSTEYSSSFSTTVLLSPPQPSATPITPVRASESSRPPGRRVIGTWVLYSMNNGPTRTVHAYDDQIPRTLYCMIFFMILFFVLGTPLSLFLTIPALYWMCKVKQSVKDNDMNRAKSSFGKCRCISTASIVFVFVILVMAATILPVPIVLST